MRKKSHGVNVALTLLLGPLGLFYASAWQAVVLALIAIAVAGAGFAINPVVGVPGLLWVWGLAILLGAFAVKAHNTEIRDREELEERRHREMVAAAAGARSVHD